ncbi:DUF6884 domain-containing protein [Streptomyces roseifaciens]|uniref:DUF6884 domain-containing protein n=1 Tax=Streptomyces roseifaciens TaxID=1488406 RepID=UPI0007183155|nr:DUF6884 domain-containing protein [Streptomyces roseifaciens]
MQLRQVRGGVRGSCVGVHDVDGVRERRRFHSADRLVGRALQQGLGNGSGRGRPVADGVGQDVAVGPDVLPEQGAGHVLAGGCRDARHRDVPRYHRSLRRAAHALTDPSLIRVVSALHGLVPLEQWLRPYDVTLGDPRAVTGEKLARHTAREGLDDAEVIFLGGREYAELLRGPGGQRTRHQEHPGGHQHPAQRAWRRRLRRRQPVAGDLAGREHRRTTMRSPRPRVGMEIYGKLLLGIEERITPFV